MLEIFVVFVVIVLLCLERVGVEASGEVETEVTSVLKLLVCWVPVLHDTCGFSLLFFLLCYLCDSIGLYKDVRV